MAPSWMVRAVVLAHSEPRHSNLGAPMYQPHPATPKTLLPFRTRFPSFAARLRGRLYPFFWSPKHSQKHH